MREASPVLQSRRERLEELNIEAQEVRARRELAILQREEQEEAERREAEAQAREDEAARREAEIDLEQRRLAREEAQERKRTERERLQDQQRREAEEKLAAFHQRWHDAAAEAATAPKLAWLTATQSKELNEALEAEIERRQPPDEPRMGLIIARSMEALVEPLKAERDAQETRQKLTEEALRRLPYSATDAERVRAKAAVEEALRPFDRFVDVYKMRAAVAVAVEPVCQAIERRLMDTRLVTWALQSLPWSRTDLDEARIRRECAEILADLRPRHFGTRSQGSSGLDSGGGSSRDRAAPSREAAPSDQGPAGGGGTRRDQHVHAETAARGVNAALMKARSPAFGCHALLTKSESQGGSVLLVCDNSCLRSLSAALEKKEQLSTVALASLWIETESRLLSKRRLREMKNVV